MTDRGLRGRADLVHAFEGREDCDLERIARALGYEADDTQELKPAPKRNDPDNSEVIEKTTTIKRSHAAPLHPIPFLFVDGFNRIDQGDFLNAEDHESTAVGGDHVFWPSRPNHAPTFAPLRSMRSMTALLEQLASPRQETGRLDIERAVEIIAGGRLLTHPPVRRARSRARRIRVVIDHSPRLVPIWGDQVQAIQSLRAAAPNAKIDIVRSDHGAGVFWSTSDDDEHEIWPTEVDEIWIALSDLGGAKPTSSELALWTALGRALGPERAVVLSPCRLEEHDPALRDIWRIERWEEHPGFEQEPKVRKAALERLLRLLSPTLCFTPGLLRAMRLALVPEADAAIELALWTHPEIERQGDALCAVSPDRARRRLAEFTVDERISDADRRTALSLIHSFRAKGMPRDFGEDLWFPEILNLPPELRRLLEHPEETEQAKRYFGALALQASHGAAQAPGVRAWLSQISVRAPGARVEPEFRAAIKEVISSGLKQVKLCQRGGMLSFAAEEEVRAPIGIIPCEDGLIDIEPLDDFWSSIWPDGSPDWAVGHGKDTFGYWCSFQVGEIVQVLRWQPSGRFLMGSPPSEAGRYDDEGPQIEVTFEQGFWIFETPVTQAMYEVVTSENPSQFRGADRPVECVTWIEAKAFLAALNERVPGLDLRLPSEAEWEYACRAGSTTPFEPNVARRYAGLNAEIDELNYDGKHPLGDAPKGESRSETVSVKSASFRPNAWGLWHMHGNVHEWCEDVWNGSHEGIPTDGSPRPISQDENGESGRVIRGGSWNDGAGSCRAAYRDWVAPDVRLSFLGFRPARGQATGAQASKQENAERSGLRSGGGSGAELRPERSEGPPSQRGGESKFSGTEVKRLRVMPGGSASISLSELPPAPFVIRTDRVELTIQRITRTDLGGWASGMGRDRFGLWADFVYSDVRQRLRFCPPGQFEMGSPEDEAGRYDDEGPQTDITFEHGFWLFETPVTQALWRTVMATDQEGEEVTTNLTRIVHQYPSAFSSPDRPVENVSWNDAQAFMDFLNERITGLDLRLPSEAEWEYGCRAGTLAATYAGPMEILGESNAPVLDDIAWYRGNSGVDFDLDDGFDSSGWTEKQHEHSKAWTRLVKLKRANPWGLYDMIGNVWEWCEDEWHDSHEGASVNGLPRSLSKKDGETVRVIRGGSWLCNAGDCRAAYRYWNAPDVRNDDLGFRPARGQVSGAMASMQESAERSGLRSGEAVKAEPTAERSEGPPPQGGGESKHIPEAISRRVIKKFNPFAVD